MTIISVPYHLDEYLPDLDLPLQPDQVVTAGLPAGDPWERMAVLQSAVAGTVAGEVASGACPVVAALGISCSWHPGHASARHVAAELAAAVE
jgi:hypothetical protein